MPAFLRSILLEGILAFRIDWFDLHAVCPRDSQESSPAPQFEGINSLALSLFYGPALTSVHDYWKNHRFDYMAFASAFKYAAWFVIAFHTIKGFGIVNEADVFLELILETNGSQMTWS